MATATFEIDPAIQANRDSNEVLRYRVRDDAKIRGVQYKAGDIVLLRGFAAWNEVFPRFSLELADPAPVEQTTDPATWEAQYATGIHVHLNSSLVIHGDPCRVGARYAGDQGIARVQLAFDCGQWFVESHLTLVDAVRIHEELGRAIQEMTKRRFLNPDFETDEGGELYVHQMGSSV
jgi:hypothetical protein